MQYVQSSEACRLAGLTAHQLREWCIRRAIMLPDVPPSGPGRHALYSWQTLLVLRVLRQLHQDFASEVGGWAAAMVSLRAQLQGRPFPSLWGMGALFFNAAEVSIVRLAANGAGGIEGTSLQLAFDPHLSILASGMALPGPPDQLSLFPAIVVQR